MIFQSIPSICCPFLSKTSFGRIDSLFLSTTVIQRARHSIFEGECTRGSKLKEKTYGLSSNKPRIAVNSPKAPPKFPAMRLQDLKGKVQILLRERRPRQDSLQINTTETPRLLVFFPLGINYNKSKSNQSLLAFQSLQIFQNITHYRFSAIFLRKKKKQLPFFSATCP